MFSLSDNVPTSHSVPKGHLKARTVSGAPQHFQPHVQSLTPLHTGQQQGEQGRRESICSHPALPASMDCCEEGSGTLFMIKTITSDCW